MRIFRTKKAKPEFSQYVEQLCQQSDGLSDLHHDVDILVNLVRIVRPKHPKRVGTMDITNILEFLRLREDCCDFISSYLKGILHGRKFNNFLSDAAILQDTDFLYELRRRVAAKLLPNQPQKDRLEYVLNQAFYLASDIKWISKIPLSQLEELFDLLQFDSIYESVDPDSPLSEMMLAMNLIIQRVSGRAMETDVIKMVPEFDELESPFTAFEIELLGIEERIKSQPNHFIMQEDLAYRQLQVLMTQCREFVEKAFSNSAKYGISLRVNQGLLKIRQQLDRISTLMPLLTIKNADDKRENTIRLAIELIRFNCYKNNVRKFISESTQLLSYEITQHTANTGEHYITGTKKEYFLMFRAALGGGFIVGILCIIKVYLGTVDTSYFGKAVIYSLNYAIGFITIYLLGFTLATKQPAMTASALIRALEEKNKEGSKESHRYNAFANLFARVFRSQFIAFVGNVIMAFPIALAGVYAIDYLSDYNIAATKSIKLITDISPLHSAAIYHAAIAGVFLFLSGIISGSIANRDKHEQIYYRIEEHPFLKRTLGPLRAKKIALIYEKRWAGFISNFWFGVFMGSTASIGLFLGLDLDVRHITFVSGNLALGLYGADFKVDDFLLFWALLGIGVIGLVNFLVSFSLSLGLAFRSRDISLFELRYVTLAIWKHFLKRPFSFFFPIGDDKTSR